MGIRAHTVDILTEGGQVVTTHRRAYGDNRTDISDYSTTLAVLMKNSGAWGNSGLRRETPDALRAYMDAQPKEKLKDCLRIMNELTSQYGFQAAVQRYGDSTVQEAVLTSVMLPCLPQGLPDMAFIHRRRRAHPLQYMMICF
ncbi:MAG: hypothetical protein ACLTPC_18710 [Lacrimispora saccharolytica]